MDQRWGVGVSGGSVERGNLTPDREALIYFGSHWVALSRCRRGRKCAEMALKADRNRWAGTVTLVSVGALEGSVG